MTKYMYACLASNHPLTFDHQLKRKETQIHVCPVCANKGIFFVAAILEEK
jgi:hypothetical protein